MPRNVVFFAPHPFEAVMRFVRAVAKLDDVRLLGVVHTPPAAEMKLFHDVVRVSDPESLPDLLDAVALLQRRHGQPHRIVGTLEGTVELLAHARERFNVPGTPVKTAELFREKSRMKDALRAAGLPVAKHKLLRSLRDARAFVEEVGFPIIVKPPAGVGAKDTFRVSTVDALLEALTRARVGPASPVLAEEMLQGREHSFETITIDGRPRVSSFSRYYPGCLEVLENPWIQWACILPREVDTPFHDQTRALGVAAIKALGLDDGMTHMECFEKPDGSLAIGEIAARPPGPQLCQMTGLVHGIDPYRAWARAVIDGELDAPWERKYAAGTAFIRGVGHGRVTAVSGMHETYEAIRPWLVEAKIPARGKRKTDSYEGDGYVVVKAESTEKVKELITTVVETMEVHYEG